MDQKRVSAHEYMDTHVHGAAPLYSHSDPRWT